MNRKNSSNGGRRTPPSRNPGETIRWAKVEPDEWAGGLMQPGYEGDAGYDMAASRQVIVPPHAFAQIPTNVRMAIPAGFWAMIVGRSSTFFKRQLMVQTAVIDNGYRGPLWCMVYNLSDGPVIVKRRERIMQVIFHPLYTPGTTEVEEVSATERGEKGFGSTGIEIQE